MFAAPKVFFLVKSFVVGLECKLPVSSPARIAMINGDSTIYRLLFIVESDKFFLGKAFVVLAGRQNSNVVGYHKNMLFGVFTNQHAAKRVVTVTNLRNRFPLRARILIGPEKLLELFLFGVKYVEDAPVIISHLLGKFLPAS